MPAVAARRGSACLVGAGVAWLSGVLIIAAAFDVPEFANEAVNRSYGGWALIAAAAGLLAGCYACQLLFPDPRRRCWPRPPASSRWPPPRPELR